MKKLPAIFFFALGLGIIFAQDNRSLPFAVSLSYFGETISHPGISVRVDYGLFETGGYRLSLSGTAGWYLHRRNHNAFFLAGGARNSLASSFGLFGDFDLEAGIISAAPDGAVYANEGGTVQAVPVRRDIRFLLMTGIGGGWKIPGFAGLPLAPYLRLGAFGEYPFNGYLYPHLFLETGINMYL
jgi:hypothetical protein